MWLLPSRRRPANLAQFFAACKATGVSTGGVVLVDDDDFAEHEAEYNALAFPPGWFVQRSKGVTQGEKIAEVWDDFQDCAWLGLIGDDCVPETPGWDRLLVEQLAGGGIVSCNDGWKAPDRIGNCWIMSGPVIRAAGYIFPPGMHHLFVDDVWEILGRATGAWETRMDVMVRHAHVLKGDAPADDTHRAVYGEGFTQAAPGPDRSAGLWAGDEAVFRAWRDGGECRRAIAAIGALGATVPIQMRLKRAKSRSVMICTPMARHPTRQWANSAIQTTSLLMQLGIRCYFQEVVGASNLPRARNELVAAFLASYYDDCLMIDDDMGWDANDVVRLLASPQPLIGAVGPKKVELPDTKIVKWCARWLPGPELNQDDMGAIEVEAVGTGFLKIAREVFEALIAAHPDWKRNGWPDMPQAAKDQYYRFFRFPDDDPDETGEDYQFCFDWRATGGKVWIDPEINLIHAGDKEYSGHIGALFREKKAA